MRPIFVALFALLLAAPAGAESVLPSERIPWIRIHTPHFLVYSNAEESDAREVGVGLERQLEAMTAVLRGMKSPVAVPNIVFVFRDKDSFEPYTLDAYQQPMSIGGYYLQSDELNQLAILLPRGGDAGNVVHHEFTHLLLHSNVSLRTFPIWLDEGLAEYFSTFEADERTAKIGAPNRGITQWLSRNEMYGLRRMFAVKSVDAEYHEPDLQAHFYSTAWATVHYLKQGPPARQRQFAAFLDSLQAGLRPVDAFEKVFGTSGYEQIGAEVKSYLDDGNLETRDYGLRDPLSARVGGAEPASRTEILWRLGDLLAHQPKENHPAAEDHFRAALKLDSLCAAAYAGWGGVAGADERFDQADRYFDRAIQLAPHDPFVLGRCGRNCVRRYQVAEEGKCARGGLPGSLARARRFLDEAVKLDPGDFSVRGNLGITYLCGGDSLGIGRAALDQAYEAMPFRADLLMSAIYLEARSGEAGKAARRIAVDLKQRVPAEDLRRAQEWVDQGSEMEGSSPAAGGAAAIAAPGASKKILIRTAAQEEADRSRHWLEVYNDATEQASSANLHQAEKLFKMVADSTPDKGLALQARGMEGQAHNDNLLQDASMLLLDHRYGEARQLYEHVIANRPNAVQKASAEGALLDLKRRGRAH